MATHVYLAAMEALARALRAGVTNARSVHVARFSPLRPVDLPALNLRYQADEIEDLSIGNPYTQERRATVIVEALAAAQDGLDAELLALLAQVERAVAADVTLGGAATRAAYRGTDEMEMEDTGEGPIGRLPIRVEMELFTMSNAPETAI